jgi:hypothetical protein
MAEFFKNRPLPENKKAEPEPITKQDVKNWYKDI